MPIQSGSIVLEVHKHRLYIITLIAAVDCKVNFQLIADVLPGILRHILREIFADSDFFTKQYAIIAMNISSPVVFSIPAVAHVP